MKKEIDERKCEYELLAVSFLSYNRRKITMIMEGQFYTVKNLLSYRTRVDSNELDNLLVYVQNSLGALGLKINGNIFLTYQRKFRQKTR